MIRVGYSIMNESVKLNESSSGEFNRFKDYISNTSLKKRYGIKTPRGKKSLFQGTIKSYDSERGLENLMSEMGYEFLSSKKGPNDSDEIESYVMTYKNEDGNEVLIQYNTTGRHYDRKTIFYIIFDGKIINESIS